MSTPSNPDDDPVAVIEIDDVLDLHGFQPSDIPSVVEEYVRAVAQKGFGEVRLIHGRGTGFQRQRVREVAAPFSSWHSQSMGLKLRDANGLQLPPYFARAQMPQCETQARPWRTDDPFDGVNTHTRVR
jgi:hypothetical protein